MEIDHITGMIIDEAMNIHKSLGPGLLESVYETVLTKKLRCVGLDVCRQKMVPINFEGLHFEEAFRCDLIVEDRVVVELKSVETLHPVHKKQLMTYLRLMNLHVGLLINFGAPMLKDGLTRIVTGYEPSDSSLLRINSLATAQRK